MKLLLKAEITGNSLRVKSERASNKHIKNMKSMQVTTLSLIKQAMVETHATFYKKLNFVGVGFRALDVQDFEGEIFLLKLGYSHPIYYRLPSTLNIFCLKRTKLFVFGSSYTSVAQLASKIRSLKRPEPYKGKGIQYSDETIELKEGKKV